jgi:hypothetical protein
MSIVCFSARKGGGEQDRKRERKKGRKRERRGEREKGREREKERKRGREKERQDEKTLKLLLTARREATALELKGKQLNVTVLAPDVVTTLR